MYLLPPFHNWPCRPHFSATHSSGRSVWLSAPFHLPCHCPYQGQRHCCYMRWAFPSPFLTWILGSIWHCPSLLEAGSSLGFLAQRLLGFPPPSVTTVLILLSAVVPHFLSLWILGFLSVLSYALLFYSTYSSQGIPSLPRCPRLTEDADDLHSDFSTPVTVNMLTMPPIIVKQRKQPLTSSVSLLGDNYNFVSPEWKSW